MFCVWCGRIQGSSARRHHPLLLNTVTVSLGCGACNPPAPCRHFQSNMLRLTSSNASPMTGDVIALASFLSSKPVAKTILCKDPAPAAYAAQWYALRYSGHERPAGAAVLAWPAFSAPARRKRRLSHHYSVRKLPPHRRYTSVAANAFCILLLFVIWLSFNSCCQNRAPRPISSGHQRFAVQLFAEGEGIVSGEVSALA